MAAQEDFGEKFGDFLKVSFNFLKPLFATNDCHFHFYLNRKDGNLSMAVGNTQPGTPLNCLCLGGFARQEHIPYLQSSVGLYMNSMWLLVEEHSPYNKYSVLKY